MTEKQEKILRAALELFARDGFKSTSTSKVAAHAGVSEGLIFRHFKNKEGLLEAIIQEGEERVKILFADIIFETDPKAVIRKTFDTLLNIKSVNEEMEFWKLQYKVKWETEQYGEQKMIPLEMALTSAFEKLGYESPEQEAQIVLLTIDGLATKYFLQKHYNLDNMVAFLKTKYNL